MDEFLKYGDLEALTGLSSSSYFNQRHIADATQRDLVEPLIVDYPQQGLDAHAFASLVALTSAVGAASVDTGDSASLYAGAGRHHLKCCSVAALRQQQAR